VWHGHPRVAKEEAGRRRRSGGQESEDGPRGKVEVSDK